ncbi:MAG: Nif3-like dinuclear metal center hexameric protein [Candidatus Aegiribacteria sp.]|nr:Nif3-like dinuclear metal center hexameric protein [Candidatus Aegiribacteria sp.]
MNLSSLTTALDSEFKIAENKENLVEWAVTEETEDFINPEFLKHHSGLMLQASDSIDRVFTSVFISDCVVEKMMHESNSFLFTHHQFNYYEDERGLQAISPDTFDKLLDNGISIYVAHAPLDTHPQYGTSISLAKFTGVSIENMFYDYFGAPTALIGHILKSEFADYSAKIMNDLNRPCLTLQQHSPYVEKIAVVAGGGDEPDILRYAYESGCDTMLTGTVEHRWAAPSVQEKNKLFHELNKELKLNLIGGTHYGTERPAMIRILDLFKNLGIKCEYCEDGKLLNAE